MLTVRLTPSEEKALNQYCELEGLSKSEVVKEAIELYLLQHRKTQNLLMLVPISSVRKEAELKTNQQPIRNV